MDVVAALQQVNAPYQLHAGTLLGFARDCRLKSDIDFAIPRKWFRQDKSGNNEDSLKKAMGARGFKFMYSIGKIDEFGYELSFKRLEIKVDFFTIDEAEATFHWGYWGKPSGLHRCTVNRTAVRGDFRWGISPIYECQFLSTQCLRPSTHETGERPSTNGIFWIFFASDLVTLREAKAQSPSSTKASKAKVL